MNPIQLYETGYAMTCLTSPIMPMNAEGESCAQAWPLYRLFLWEKVGADGHLKWAKGGCRIPVLLIGEDSRGGTTNCQVFITYPMCIP